MYLLVCFSVPLPPQNSDSVLKRLSYSSVHMCDQCIGTSFFSDIIQKCDAKMCRIFFMCIKKQKNTILVYFLQKIVAETLTPTTIVRMN